MRIIIWFGVIIALLSTVVTASAQGKKPSKMSSVSVDYNVTCSPKWMIVAVSVNSTSALVYLEKLQVYPGCEPEHVGGKAIFRLPLDNIIPCGTARILNKRTGVRIYYHRVIVEEPEVDKQEILVTCKIPPSHNNSFLSDVRSKRDVLPENFAEPENINITDYIVASAPVPFLNLAIRQHGKVLDTTQNVQPGTPLEMLIYLDENSAGTYGLLASYLKVTDSSPEQEEVIIMNGCSIDPYIFGNFQSLDGGDALTAKFRAFKFPDANYVLFVGTVSVCIQQCRGVPCGNEQLGYGKRRRRSIPQDLPEDKNKLYEVEMTTFLKVEFSPEHFTLNKGSLESGFEGKGQKAPESSSNHVEAFTQSKTPGSSATRWGQCLLLQYSLLLAVILLPRITDCC